LTVPTQYDFAILEYSDMAGVPVFTALCGLTNISVNEVAETSSRRVRDCATPNTPGGNVLKVLGTSWTISGTGLTNAAQRAYIKASLFARKVNYKVKYYSDDSTPTGLLKGTDAGLAILTANNMALDQEGDSSLELTLEGQGTLVYTPAP
jgi:Phage tail tube protein